MSQFKTGDIVICELGDGSLLKWQWDYRIAQAQNGLIEVKEVPGRLWSARRFRLVRRAAEEYVDAYGAN